MAVRLPQAVKTVNPATSGLIDPDFGARRKPAKTVKRPDIKISAAPEEKSFTGPLFLTIGFFAVMGVWGFTHRGGSAGEDPNFVRAQTNVAQYELGRTVFERNYDDPVYEEALTLLAQVDARSKSSGAAATLSDEIKHRRDVFHQRLRAREKAQAEVQQAVIDREGESLQAHEMNLLMPQTSFPECKEGGGHAH